MLKSQEVSYPDSTFNKAKPDEPLFIIRPTDKLAPEIILNWAQRLLNEVTKDMPTNQIVAINLKASAAIELAEQVQEFQKLHGSKIPD